MDEITCSTGICDLKITWSLSHFECCPFSFSKMVSPRSEWINKKKLRIGMRPSVHCVCICNDCAWTHCLYCSSSNSYTYQKFLSMLSKSDICRFPGIRHKMNRKRKLGWIETKLYNTREDINRVDSLTWIVLKTCKCTEMPPDLLVFYYSTETIQWSLLHKTHTPIQCGFRVTATWTDSSIWLLSTEYHKIYCLEHGTVRNLTLSND